MLPRKGPPTGNSETSQNLKRFKLQNYWHLRQKFSLTFQKHSRCLNVSGKEEERLWVCYLGKISVRKEQF